jgi:hypothetical protein
LQVIERRRTDCLPLFAFSPGLSRLGMTGAFGWLVSFTL